MYCYACGGKKKTNVVCPFCSFNYMNEVKEFVRADPDSRPCVCGKMVREHKMEFDEVSKKYKRFMFVMCDGARIKPTSEYK